MLAGPRNQPPLDPPVCLATVELRPGHEIATFRAKDFPIVAWPTVHVAIEPVLIAAANEREATPLPNPDGVPGLGPVTQRSGSKPPIEKVPAVGILARRVGNRLSVVAILNVSIGLGEHNPANVLVLVPAPGLSPDPSRLG